MSEEDTLAQVSEILNNLRKQKYYYFKIYLKYIY